MFSLNVQVRGNITRRLTSARRKMDLFADVLIDVGEELEKKIKQNLKGPILKYQSGTLHDSISYVLFENNKGEWDMEVGSVLDEVPYARIHEFGGYTNVAYLPARHYIDRSIEQKQAYIRSRVNRFFNEIFR